MSDLLMPKFSESMEEGVILAWLIRDGESVISGDGLVEIETDKTTVTHAAEESGILRIVAPEGSQCRVGDVIACIGEYTEGDAVKGAPDSWPTPILDLTIDPPPVSVVASHKLPNRNSTTGLVATPLARRTATFYDVSLEDVPATGPGGCVTFVDVLVAAKVDQETKFAPSRYSRSMRAFGIRDGADAERNDTDAPNVIPLTRLQQVVAERMTHAHSIPTFQVQTDVILDKVNAIRDVLKMLEEVNAVPSLNDFIIRASALALERVPIANASYTSKGIEYHDRINVGFAVASERSLLVPTVFDANKKSANEIAEETQFLAERCRNSKIAPHELADGTFTVSNLGMYGMTTITPLINPPQSAIIGVGAARPELVMTEGNVEERTVMTLTVSCDHRILYGADASRFLNAVRDFLERPLTCLL